MYTEACRDRAARCTEVWCSRSVCEMYGGVCDQFASCTEVRIMGVGGWGVVVVTESEVQVVKPYGWVSDRHR